MQPPRTLFTLFLCLAYFWSFVRVIFRIVSSKDKYDLKKHTQNGLIFSFCCMFFRWNCGVWISFNITLDKSIALELCLVLFWIVERLLKGFSKSKHRYPFTTHAFRDYQIIFCVLYIFHIEMRSDTVKGYMIPFLLLWSHCTSKMKSLIMKYEKRTIISQKKRPTDKDIPHNKSKVADTGFKFFRFTIKLKTTLT